MTLDDEAAEAAALWGGKILRLIKNRENAVFEMALPHGRAALRLHRVGYQSLPAIQSELWWVAALAAAGVAVPAPAPTQGGDMLATLSNGRIASAIRWVEGEPLGVADIPFVAPLDTLVAQYHALGELVAQVHAATSALALPSWFTRAHWDAAALAGDDPFSGKFWQHPVLQPSEATELLAARGFLRDWLAALPHPDIGPIHADVLRENVLIDGTRLSLIDFDDSGIGYRLYDLGTAMRENLEEPHYTDLRDALVAGYGRASVEEVEVFTLARTLVSVAWAAPRLPMDNPTHRRRIDSALNWAGRVMRQYG